MLSTVWVWNLVLIQLTSIIENWTSVWDLLLNLAQRKLFQNFGKGGVRYFIFFSFFATLDLRTLLPHLNARMISKNAMQNFKGINQHFSIEENHRKTLWNCGLRNAFFCLLHSTLLQRKKAPNSDLFPCHWIFSHDFYLVPNIFLLFAEKIQVHEPKGRVIKERHLQMGIVLASWNEHSKSKMVEVYSTYIPE